MSPGLLSNLSPIRRIRLLRLTSLDGAAHGPWLGQAACTAARLGRNALAWRLMTSWLDGDTPASQDAVLARDLLDMERSRVKTAISWRREWPKGIIHLEDIPAWLVIPAVRLLRRMGRKGPIHLISGGHLLKPGTWNWCVPAGSWRPSEVEVTPPRFMKRLDAAELRQQSA